MRSSKSEDLNIQSSFTSSFLSRSCRLPREQCSVTTANMEKSWKKPRKGFTFSFLRSFIWREEKTQSKPTIAPTDELKFDMELYLGENPGGALFHLFELALLKFLQPNPVTLSRGDRLRVCIR